MSSPLDKRQFDFWYAVNNTEVVLLPANRLETFGTTQIRYHFVSELMDSVDKVRVREGVIQSFRPQILTPSNLLQDLLEGFQNSEAERYVDWLRRHEQNIAFVQYGFKIRNQGTSEEVVSAPLDAVVERVKSAMQEKQDPLAALVRGVDEPWEVCLLKLMVDMIRHSAPRNMSDLRADPDGARNAVEQAFLKAARDRTRLGELSDLLHRMKLFDDYQDRFFSLVASHRA
jgi:hypothetical protein